MNCQRIRLLLLLTPFASFIMGQGAVTIGTAAGGSFSGTASFSYSPVGPATLTGASYSGEEASESVQVLGDGTKITRTTPSRKMYRDFAGRTRTERALFPRPQAVGATPLSEAVLVEIYDPVLGFRYTLDTVNHVAHRLKVQPLAPPAAANRSAAPLSSAPVAVTQPVTTTPPSQGGAARPRPKMASESLGTQIINGVQSEGQRSIETIPIGAQGNDRPINVITETWASSELKITVLSRRSDPRSNETTRQVLNLSRAEPDPLLFTIPADYTVVDETGDFTIRYSQ